MENKRIIGPEKDILEVMNAIAIYEKIDILKSGSEKTFLDAHKNLMNGLIENPGKYRTRGVGVVKGSQVAHLAPPAENVPGLMKDLFRYLKKDEDLELIKSCVFHYELEFIHPFLDGNGRMGRLWQTVILKDKYPVFESLPFETLISKTQNEYYHALAVSDKSGNSTAFIKYMLAIIDLALSDLLKIHGKSMQHKDRISYFLSLGKSQFTRKEYMEVFKTISTATASRDLKKAVENGIFRTEGSGNKTRYSVIPAPSKNP